MSTLPPVVGLDPSLTAAGLATAAGTFVIGEDGKKGATMRERHARLHRSTTAIGLAVGEAAAAAGAAGALVVIETPAYDSRTGSQHDRSGLWWLVVDELLSAGHLVVEITGGQRAKYATGKGGGKGAGKTAVASAATHRYGVPFTNDNEADAFVLRAMGLHQLGAPLATVPKLNASALEAVAWPTEFELERLVALPRLGHRTPGPLDAAPVDVPGQLAIA